MELIDKKPKNKEQAKKILSIMAMTLQTIERTSNSMLLNVSGVYEVFGVDFDDEELIGVEHDLYDIMWRAKGLAKALKEKSK